MSPSKVVLAERVALSAAVRETVSVPVPASIVSAVEKSPVPIVIVSLPLPVDTVSLPAPTLIVIVLSVIAVIVVCIPTIGSPFVDVGVGPERGYGCRV